MVQERRQKEDCEKVSETKKILKKISIGEKFIDIMKKNIPNVS
jgi:hypothetical protein